MTVVHVIEPFASGVTTAVINITRQLSEVNHVVVHGSRMWVDTQDNVKRKFPPGVRFIPWKHAGREIHPVKDLRAFLELLNILKKYRKEVIHLHSSKAGFLGRAACRLLRIRRVIYTPHCPAFIRTDISSRKQGIYRSLEKLGSLFGGLVVGCGKTEAELYRELGRPAHWVANGVQPHAVEKTPEPRKVTFVGIANHQKNPGLFNDIAKSFRKDEVSFLWVGDGELKNLLQAENITITGWKEKSDVEFFLKDTLIYLSTSGWEGLPFGVLEAMNASCALLLTDVPGNRDLVREGKNGFLFKTREEAVVRIRQMLADPAGTMDMGRTSRELIETEYSLEQMGQGYLDIYRSL